MKTEIDVIEKVRVPESLRPGRGGLNIFSYSAQGIKLKSKIEVLKAISLKLEIQRKNKINKVIKVFNYEVYDFAAKKVK